jgi:hypothetical protein
MQVIDTHVEVPCTTKREWNTSLAKMLNSIAFTKTSKPQEVLFSPQNKLIFIEEVFQDINKQMLKMNHT